MMSGVGDTSGVDVVRYCCCDACRTLVEPRVWVRRTGDQSDAARAHTRAPAHGREIARRARAFRTRLCRGNAAVPPCRSATPSARDVGQFNAWPTPVTLPLYRALREARTAVTLPLYRADTIA